MTASNFKKLSCDAKILYGLMLDRMGLSMKNGWIDDENKVYIFFTLDDVYECLIRGYGVERVDEYVGLMLDVICSKSKTVRIGRGEYPLEVVRSRFLKLDHTHLEYVMDRMAKNTTKIRNIRNYLLTALYNSFTSIDGYYQAEVNHDFYGDK